MLRLLLTLFYLAQLVQGTSFNATDSSCPPLDGTPRSIWGILGSCALTLLICVWHTIHFDFPRPTYKWWEEPVTLVLSSFLAPEIVVMAASAQWLRARRRVKRFREKGYHWSMTHSFFAEMGGFVYRDDKGASRTISSYEFLDLCESNNIANPVVTVKEIKDRNKSDALGKTILTIVVYATVLFFWWNKPLRPNCPHIFYSPQEVKVDPQMYSALSTVWKAEPNYLDSLIASLSHIWGTRSITDDEETTLVGKDEPALSKFNMIRIDDKDINAALSCGAWMVLGALHLMAWNFDFLTETEKILWRVASLALAGCPLAFLGAWAIVTHIKLSGWTKIVVDTIKLLGCAIGFVSRMLLVVLMLASLRSLPRSAYQTVSWTAYIPHP